MVTEEARAAETEIDAEYRRQPLLSYRHDDAIRSTLTAANALLDDFSGSSRYTYGIAVDTIINGLKHAIGWLWAERDLTRLVQPVGDPVDHAKLFILLAIEYVGMVAAYTHAGDNLLDLRCEGRTLRISGALLRQQQYEAYNQLIKSSVEAGLSEVDTALAAGESLMAAITRAAQRHVPIERVPLDDEVVSVAYHTMINQSAKFYMLPSDWRFSRFSPKAFRIVHALIGGILYAWNRIAPVMEREPWLVRHGAHQPFCVTRGEIVSRAASIGGISKAEARAVVDVLEYSKGGINNPDPVLQPLIPLRDGRYVLSKPLILGSAAERNLTVLINKLPEEKAVYSRLTNRKEAEMRTRISRRLGTRFQVWHGSLAGHDVTNVDLAVIDPNEHALLFFELKWFIDPAEVRELRERSEELSKGIKQCKTLLALASVSPTVLDRIPGGPFRVIGAAVVSANWIGFGNIQDRDVPIITEEHIVRKLLHAGGLSEVIAWLQERAYLPLPGRDYSVVERPCIVGEWDLEWYRILPVGQNDFMPL